MDKQKKMENDIDFSLVLGGPIYRLYLWTGLAKKPLLQYRRRIVVICLFAWLPLLLLTIFTGIAFSGVEVPFLYDIDVHVRFLISLALLIFSEVVMHERLQLIVQQFLNCNIIPLDQMKKFNSLITSVNQLTNSTMVEVFILIFVVITGHWISQEYFPFAVSAWYGSKVNNVIHLSLPGYWYAFISLPFFQFMILRWYYRIAIWYRFLWQVSRLPLQLNSLHPDRAGGIGFLANSVYAFEPLLLAHSVLLAGMIFNRIWNAGASPAQFKVEIVSIMVFLIILPLSPLMFFMFSLIKTKRNGTFEYATVANRYVNIFRKKWIDSESKNDESLLGTPDIQSLADLTNSFTVSAQMRIVPFGRGSIISIVILTALPLLPLIFTIMPFDKIIAQTINVIL